MHCCVTSPPYFGLRDYGVDGQMGLEPTPDEFVAGMVDVFREVRRVLRDDGTLWLNIGDSYSRAQETNVPQSKHKVCPMPTHTKGSSDGAVGRGDRPGTRTATLAPKQLLGIPWRLAFALQADGWYLRQDIIWSKPNPMPESVRDRCTKAHEYLFLLSKGPKYHFDAYAIRNPPSEALIQQVCEGYNGSDTKTYEDSRAQSASGTKSRIIQNARAKLRGHDREHEGFRDKWDAMSREEQMALGSNKRSVWEVATQPFGEAHFATYPPALIEPCILAGCPKGGTVLDPFGGAGTTGLVADRLQRDAILVELNPDYAAIAQRRLGKDGGMFSEVLAA